MDLRLAGKLALVTGATKGIGRAIAVTLAAEGCALVLVARNDAELGTLSSNIRKDHGVTADVVAADLAQASEIDRVALAVPHLDILVNNAGSIPAGDLAGTGDAAWRAAWDLKVFGYIGLARALYSTLQRRQGVILNIIGGAGETGDPDYIAGSAGNAALMSFTRTLAKQASKDGMRVVGINPGPVATERLEKMERARAQRTLGDENRWREMLSTLPFGRPATAQEISNAAAFLVSPCSAYTNGAILTIDGGPG